mgnify:CR=1 FL=1|tara:strand:+ start:671 stop:868 length:198 start_codon:yes stop_codon:yes gene_type:complete
MLNTETDLAQALREKIVALEAEIANLNTQLEPVRSELIRLTHKHNRLVDLHGDTKMLLANLLKEG